MSSGNQWMVLVAAVAVTAGVTFFLTRPAGPAAANAADAVDSAPPAPQSPAPAGSIPAPVRATFERQAAGAQPFDVRLDSTGSAPVYVAQVVLPVGTYEIAVRPDGVLARKELQESAQSLTAAELPPGVAAALAREAAGATVEEYERVDCAGTVTFAARIAVDGHHYRLTVTPAGVLVAKVLVDDED